MVVREPVAEGLHQLLRKIPVAGSPIGLGFLPAAPATDERDALPERLVVSRFATDRLTAAVSPLKAFEYLSMERPVVATDLPELESTWSAPDSPWPEADEVVAAVRSAVGSA